MKSEHLLAKTLKEMMSKQSLDKISVSELSKKCNISRKTFYYHYHDLYDLLAQVYLDERMPEADKTETVTELIEVIWKYYKKNEKFIDATFVSAGKDLFFEFIYNIFYHNGMKYLNKYNSTKKLALETRKSFARFFSSGYSHAITYYLSAYKSKSLKGLCKCVDFIDRDVFVASIQKASQNDLESK